MIEPRDPNREIDPHLMKLLESLEPIPTRDPEAVTRGRSRFLAEVEALVNPEQTRPLALFGRGSKLRMNGMEDNEMPVTRRRIVQYIFSLVIASLFILFGGAGLTAYASKSALPGDTLYPLKTTLEQTRVALAADAAAQARLHLAFAERRLDEMAGLIARGQFDALAQAAIEFEQSVQLAIASLERVAAGNPAEAQALAMEISLALSRYAQTLLSMLANLPEDVKPGLLSAINASKEASVALGNRSVEGEIEFIGVVETMGETSWVIAGRTVAITVQTEIKHAIQAGDTVKVHALVSADGSLTAREIELARAIEEAERPQEPDQPQEPEQPQVQEIEFTGVVEAIGETTWVIAGRTVAITAQTEIKHAIQVGDTVKVHALVTADGRLTARQIELVQAPQIEEAREVRFTGVVETKGEGSWTVSGRRVIVTAQTDVRGFIRVGDLVEVRSFLNADGSFAAFRIDLKEEGGTEVRFTGVVESIGATTWTVGGQTVVVTLLTEIKDFIQPGDLVEVRAVLGVDGVLVASRIELDD